MPEEKTKEFQKSKKYTRREFIKAGAKVGIGAGIWGGVGYIFGKGWQSAKDYYNSEIGPEIEQTRETMRKYGRYLNSAEDKAEEVVDYFGSLFERKEKTQREKEIEISKEEPVSRRDFFTRYMLPAIKETHEKPVETLTLAGIVFGAGKTAIRLFPEYLTKRKIAKLMDENVDQTEKIKVLEEYRTKLEQTLKEKEERYGHRLNELERELENVKRATHKGLEKTTEEHKENKLIIIIGFIGLIISLILGSSKLTGFSIINNFIITDINPIFNDMNLSIIVFIISLLLFHIGKISR